MIIAGIDYSYTSPAICIGEEGSLFPDCTILFFTKIKKLMNTFNDHIIGIPLDKSLKGTLLYESIALQVANAIEVSKTQKVYIEGYSMGSITGRSFEIGENVGILKSYLDLLGIDGIMTPIPPTSLKKVATGKGNATKLMMKKAFETEYPDIKLEEILGTEQENPISDIIDAYYLFKYGRKLT